MHTLPRASGSWSAEKKTSLFTYDSSLWQDNSARTQHAIDGNALAHSRSCYAVLALVRRYWRRLALAHLKLSSVSSSTVSTRSASTLFIMHALALLLRSSPRLTAAGAQLSPARAAANLR